MEKEGKEKYLILECRFYNSEDENPFSHDLDEHEVDKSHLSPPESMKIEYTLPYEKVVYLQNAATAWSYEKVWVEKSLNKEGVSLLKELVDEYNHFFSEFEVSDSTPVELKALLWNRYDHWASGSPEDFKVWYKTYYNSRATNRQRRAVERRKILIPRCRYYKGEEECHHHSNDYQMFWSYEKMWVEALSYSFKCGEEWRKDFEKAHALMLAKKHDIPATLLGLLYNRYMHFGSGGEDSETFCKWIEESYIAPKENMSSSLSKEEKQDLANKCAHESSFDYAEYLGESDGKSVFLACSNNSASTGLPMFITIDKYGKVESECSQMYMDMVKE